MLSAGLVALLAVVAALAAWPPDLELRLERPAGVPSWRPGQAQARRAAELEWVESLVAELRAGGDPVSALVASAVTAPRAVAPRALAAARGGGDVGAALVQDAGPSELLRGVAACWAVAQGSGAGLAAALVSLADSARAAERVRRELQAGLAEPRATAVVLAGLPIVGLVMGTALGADPLSWLLGSTPGRVVLAAGIAFEVLGAWWAWRIASQLEAAL